MPLTSAHVTKAEEASDGHEHGPPTPAKPELAHPSQWPWLPKQDQGDLAPHPYRPDTGEVMAVGTSRALDEGGLVNLLADLSRLLGHEGIKVASVQRRLILNRLRERDAADPFGLTRETQLEIIAQEASRILGMHKDVLTTYLRAC